MLAAAVLACLPALPVTAGEAPSGFAALCTARVEAAAKANEAVVPGVDKNWLFLSSELRHLGRGDFWTQPATGGNPVAVISSYQKELAALGVDLVVMPVPCKAAVYPDKLAGEGAGEPPSLTPFLAKLAALGVAVIDLEPVFREQREKTKMYCASDSHWSPAACQVAAEQVWALVKDRAWVAGAGKKRDAQVLSPAETISITGDLTELPGGKSGAREEVEIVKAGSPGPVAAVADSPVVLIGDSHTVVFSAPAGAIRIHCVGAGLRDHLQAKFGFPLTVLANASSGGDRARSLARDKAAAEPGWWSARKLVVWVFSARELTAGKWREIKPAP